MIKSLLLRDSRIKIGDGRYQNGCGLKILAAGQFGVEAALRRHLAR